MADKTETITLLPHPINYETKLPETDKDSRTEGTAPGGKDVWKLWAEVPWTQYPVNFLTYPRTDSTKPVIGTYQVELSRGNLMNNKTPGSSRDYDYFWNAITWKLLGEQEAPAPSANGGQSAGSSGGGGYSRNNDEVMNRSVSISYAKDLLVAGKIERSELFEVAANMYDSMTTGFTEVK